MKFLCDQCKAKYQIADEKVQGKTLRMKCRKCGHVIEIRAATGASVPPPAGGAGETMQLSALGDDVANSLLNKPSVAPAMMPAAKTTTATAISPAAKGAPPRPNPLHNAPTRPGGIPRPDASQQTKPVSPAAIKTPQPTQSALANAFSRSVGVPSTSMPAAQHPTDPPAEEWYVAVDEVPIGPIRLTDLRGKYNAGAIHDDSLVWREGFEEWRPLRTLAELHTLVREEVSQPRGSLGTPAPRTAQPQRPSPTPAPASTAARPAGANAFKQTNVSIAPSRDVVAARQALNNVIPIRPAGPAGAAVARKLDEEDDDEVTRIAAQPIFPKKVETPIPPAPAAAVGGAIADAQRPSLADLGQRASDPFAARDPFAAPPASPFAPNSPSNAPAPMASPFAQAPAVAAAPIVAAPVPPPQEGSIVQRLSMRTGVSKGLVALIGAACLLLGVVVTVVVVKKMVQPATVVQEKVVEREVQVPVSVVAPGTTAAPAAIATTDTSASASTKAMPKYTGPTPTTATTTAAASTATPNKKLSGIDLGPDGPDPGTSPTSTGGGSDEPLDGKQVEMVAQRNKVGVTKSCYEKLVETGPANATVNIQVRPDGSVASAAADGSPSSFAGCVQRLVYGWHFPSSGSGGTFRVPFVYK